MPRITEELLRKRAEHNEGRLSTLEEVALHQLEIEKIENLDKLCRHIKILLLHNNIIEKIENVSKLKELEYLNLALNNIWIIENIEGCESLRKLDLTANFLEAENYEKSCIEFGKTSSLRELYLTGNPITDWKYYREYTIAMAPQILMLDGKEINKSERILANQKLEDLKLELLTEIELQKIKIKNKQTEKVNEEGEEYTRESRKKMYLKMAEEKEMEDRKKNPEKYEPKKESQMFKPDGEIRQCNEGKYDYTLREWDDPEMTFFELRVPKFMDTSLLDVNINPKWLSIRIKGKLTQIKLMEEIVVDKSIIQRSQMTGYLNIKLAKLNPNYIVSRMKDKEKKTKEEEKNKKIEQDKENLERSNIHPSKSYKTHDEITLDDLPDLE